jgi:hypothetical protein
VKGEFSLKFLAIFPQYRNDRKNRFNFTNTAVLEKQNRALVESSKRNYFDLDLSTDSDESRSRAGSISPMSNKVYIPDTCVSPIPEVGEAPPQTITPVSPFSLFGKLEGDYLSKLDGETCRRVLLRLSEKNEDMAALVKEAVSGEVSCS